MTVALDQLLLFGILTASAHWILARSAIMKPLWSRAPWPLDELLRCPSCSGMWLGAGLSAAGVSPLSGISLWLAVIVGGLLGAFLTPVVQAVMLWGLERTAIEVEEKSDV